MRRSHLSMQSYQVGGSGAKEQREDVKEVKEEEYNDEEAKRRMRSGTRRHAEAGASSTCIG